MTDSYSASQYLTSLANQYGLELPSEGERAPKLVKPSAIDVNSRFSWLGPRLFEATVGQAGLSRYLSDLADYKGIYPEREVRINGLLASTHLSSSLNSLIFDTLTELIKTGKVSLDAKQVELLSNVLKPPRDYHLRPDGLSSDFDPLKLEDLRMQIQRTVYDRLDSRNDKILSERVSQLKQQIRGYEEIPGDLTPLGVVGNVDVNRALSLSRKYSELKVAIHSGYIIWTFSNYPTIYIKEGKAYYSPKDTKLSPAEAVRQKDSIVRLLAYGTSRNLCALCTDRVGSDIALLDSGTIVLVCRSCEKDSRVLRLIPSVEPGDS